MRGKRKEAKEENSTRVKSFKQHFQYIIKCVVLSKQLLPRQCNTLRSSVAFEHRLAILSQTHKF